MGPSVRDPSWPASRPPGARAPAARCPLFGGGLRGRSHWIPFVMREHRASATDPTPGYRRRRADGIVALVAVAVLAVAFLVMGRVDRVPEVERDVFHAINDLPGWLGALVEPVMQLGWYGAVLIVAVGRDRRRLSLSASPSWRRPRSGRRARRHGRATSRPASRSTSWTGAGPAACWRRCGSVGAAASGLGFPSGHAAVAAAIVLVRAPLPDLAMALVAARSPPDRGVREDRTSARTCRWTWWPAWRSARSAPRS